MLTQETHSSAPWPALPKDGIYEVSWWLTYHFTLKTQHLLLSTCSNFLCDFFHINRCNVSTKNSNFPHLLLDRGVQREKKYMAPVLREFYGTGPWLVTHGKGSFFLDFIDLSCCYILSFLDVYTLFLTCPTQSSQIHVFRAQEEASRWREK
jgi:hypothetical protein